MLLYISHKYKAQWDNVLRKICCISVADHLVVWLEGVLFGLFHKRETARLKSIRMNQRVEPVGLRNLTCFLASPHSMKRL